jgi:hypothetical protein
MSEPQDQSRGASEFALVHAKATRKVVLGVLGCPQCKAELLEGFELAAPTRAVTCPLCLSVFNATLDPPAKAA